MLGIDILQKIKLTQYDFTILPFSSSVALPLIGIEIELWSMLRERASPVIGNEGAQRTKKWSYSPHQNARTNILTHAASI